MRAGARGPQPPGRPGHHPLHRGGLQPAGGAAPAACARGTGTGDPAPRSWGRQWRATVAPTRSPCPVKYTGTSRRAWPPSGSRSEHERNGYDVRLHRAGDGRRASGPPGRGAGGVQGQIRQPHPRTADRAGHLRIPSGERPEAHRPGPGQVLQRGGRRGGVLLVLLHRTPRQAPDPGLPGHGLLRAGRQAGAGRPETGAGHRRGRDHRGPPVLPGRGPLLRGLRPGADHHGRRGSPPAREAGQDPRDPGGVPQRGRGRWRRRRQWQGRQGCQAEGRKAKTARPKTAKPKATGHKATGHKATARPKGAKK